MARRDRQASLKTQEAPRPLPAYPPPAQPPGLRLPPEKASRDCGRASEAAPRRTSGHSAPPGRPGQAAHSPATSPSQAGTAAPDAANARPRGGLRGRCTGPPTNPPRLPGPTHGQQTPPRSAGSARGRQTPPLSSGPAHRWQIPPTGGRPRPRPAGLFTSWERSGYQPRQATQSPYVGCGGRVSCSPGASTVQPCLHPQNTEELG